MYLAFTIWANDTLKSDPSSQAVLSRAGPSPSARKYRVVSVRHPYRKLNVLTFSTEMNHVYRKRRIQSVMFHSITLQNLGSDQCISGLVGRLNLLI